MRYRVQDKGPFGTVLHPEETVVVLLAEQIGKVHLFISLSVRNMRRVCSHFWLSANARRSPSLCLVGIWERSTKIVHNKTEVSRKHTAQCGDRVCVCVRATYAPSVVFSLCLSLASLLYSLACLLSCLLAFSCCHGKPASKRQLVVALADALDCTWR